MSVSAHGNVCSPRKIIPLSARTIIASLNCKAPRMLSIPAHTSKYLLRNQSSNTALSDKISLVRYIRPFREPQIEYSSIFRLTKPPPLGFKFFTLRFHFIWTSTLQQLQFLDRIDLILKLLHIHNEPHCHRSNLYCFLPHPLVTSRCRLFCPNPLPKFV